MNLTECFALWKNAFPESAQHAEEEREFYGEILGHVIFPELLFHSENTPDLRNLLKMNQQKDWIRRYCDFLEKMYTDGDEDVQNILVVSILEILSDDETVWKNFGKYISKEFIRFINTDAIPNDALLWHVKPLPYK